MPTQEERLTTLEQTVALLPKRSSAEIQDLNRNVTMLFTDLAGTYAQQGNLEEACQQAMLSAQEIAQIQSSTNVTRLLQLRTKLETWNNTSPVRALDEQVCVLCTAEWYREGQ